MKSIARWVVSLGICVVTGASVWGQTPSPTVPATPPTSAALSPPSGAVTRTVEAVISALDVKANTLSLQVSSASVVVSPAAPVSPVAPVSSPQAVLATPEPRCRFTKNNRAALLSDFAVGDKVMVRLSFRTASVVVREMADVASYAEQQKRAKEITEGKIESVSAKELTVLRADGVSVPFRITPKTAIAKADAIVTLAAYPVGSAVAVKPRRLPTGSLMATVIAESGEAANHIYRDALTTWSGSVEAVDGSEKTGATIRIKRDDGAVRSFLLPANVVFKSGRSDVPWAKMVGMNVSAHLIPRSTQTGSLRTADTIKVTGTSPEDAVQAP